MELLQRIALHSPELIVDLGCGTGNVTRLLAERWPDAQLYGVDNSAQMLEQARSQSGAIHWIESGIDDWVPDRPPDLIYSNAALHWLAEHRTLFPRLAGFLNDSGCLAVQMPLSWDSPSHRLMRETLAHGGKDGQALGDNALRRAVARKWVEAPNFIMICSSHEQRVWMCGKPDTCTSCRARIRYWSGCRAAPCGLS